MKVVNDLVSFYTIDGSRITLFNGYKIFDNSQFYLARCIRKFFGIIKNYNQFVHTTPLFFHLSSLCIMYIGVDTEIDRYQDNLF